MEKGFASYNVATSMSRNCKAVDMLSFCVESGYKEVIDHIKQGDIDSATPEEFNKMFNDIKKIPGYHRIKSGMLSRGDLTQEQRIYALKSYAHTGGYLTNLFFVTIEDLQGLPYGAKIKVIDKCLDYHRVYIDVRCQVKDIEEMLFTMMLNDNSSYEKLIGGIRRYLNQ